MALPVDDKDAAEQNRDIVLTQWDSEHGPIDIHLRTIYHRDGWLCTNYEAGSMYEGTEGELYDMNNDPQQFNHLWDDTQHQTQKQALTNQLYESLPISSEEKLPRLAPV